MDLVHKLLKVFKHLGVLPQPLTPESVAQRSNAGDNKTDIVLCTLQKKLRGFFVKMAAGQFEPAEQGSTAHGAHDNAVFDLHIANLPGGK